MHGHRQNLPLVVIRIVDIDGIAVLKSKRNLRAEVSISL